MARRDPIYVGNDNLFVVRGVRNTSTGEYINDAVVELTLLTEVGGSEITGQTWPLVLTRITGSNGDYQGTIEDTLDVEDGDTGVARIDIEGEGLVAQLNLPVIFGDRAEPSLAWSSREEMEDLFGATNVAKWADKDNDESASKILRRINRAIEWATADARMKLTDTGVKLSTLTSAPVTLRDAVTRMAGVWLYESRGVEDTSDEEGKHVLTTHRKQAELYYRRIRAGIYRIDSGATRVPQVVPDEDNTDEDDDEDVDSWPD